MLEYQQSLYQQSNEARIYLLEQELNSLGQESRSIQELYFAMMLFWNEMDMIDANIPEAALSTVLKFQHHSFSRQFLRKLRPEFEHVCAVILNRGDSPHLDAILAEQVLAEETHLKSPSTHGFSSHC